MESLMSSSETFTMVSDSLSSRVSDHPDRPQPQILPNSLFRRSPPRCAIVEGENSPLEQSFSQGTDSGYSSLVPTPEQKKTENPPPQTHTKGKVPSRGLFPSRAVKLKPFEKPIPQPTLESFRDLKILFDKALFKYVSKGNERITAISIKLKVLGEDEGSSSPWIVVLCDKAVSRRVRQFFNQPHIKRQYQPSRQDALLSSFRLVVIDKPPTPTTTSNVVDVYTTATETLVLGETLCGKTIRACGQQGTRTAKIGGMIKINNEETGSKLFGITVGHIVADGDLAETPYFEHPSDETDSEEDDDPGQGLFLESDEKVEVDWGFQEDTEVHDLNEGKLEAAADQPTLANESWSKIGRIFAKSSSAEDGINLDWALIELEKCYPFQPNLVATPVFGADVAYSKNTYHELKHVARRPFAASGELVVTVLNRMSETKDAVLSISPSFLLLAPGKRFAETYTLSSRHGSGLKMGDSGSWVVDKETHTVYGHVVASDTMGDAYVVLLCDVMEQVQKRLHAQSISLATNDDILALDLENLAHPTTPPYAALVSLPALPNAHLDAMRRAPHILRSSLESRGYGNLKRKLSPQRNEEAYDCNTSAEVLDEEDVVHTPPAITIDSGYSSLHTSPEKPILQTSKRPRR